MNVVGLSAFYHDSACCLLQDGRLVAAAAEERFSRLKHDSGTPIRAFRYCLDAGGLDITDIDAVAFYEDPDKKRERHTAFGMSLPDYSLFPVYDRSEVERVLRERWGFEGKVLFFDHHHSHAASAWYYSGFSETAVFTVDGVGEWATAVYGQADATHFEQLAEINFPHSLGLFYAAVTAYLGFRVNADEYQVMGLASYGRPVFMSKLNSLIDFQDGQIRLNLPYFNFVGNGPMYSEKFIELFGRLPRGPEEPISEFHQNLACSLQRLTEEVLLRQVGWLKRRTASTNLCLAGGVALNCVAIGRLRKESGFRRIFVQPASGDDGACLGAAALAHLALGGKRPPDAHLYTTALGPEFSDEEIAALLRSAGLPFTDFSGRDGEMIGAVVQMLADKKVVGWFQGKMEFGPRALGFRSILADPRNPEIQSRLNGKIKRRAEFRPFAPSVLEHCAVDHFASEYPDPFMTGVCRVRSPLSLPGITHVDGTARLQTVNELQNPLYFSLLNTFYEVTGCPVLLNTSFNGPDEPIVCTPGEALKGLIRLKLDALVIGKCIVEYVRLPEAFLQSANFGRRGMERLFHIEHNLYSFV